MFHNDLIIREKEGSADEEEEMKADFTRALNAT